MTAPRPATRRVLACPADLKPGERRLVVVEGRSLGIFNVGGRYYALHNRCPHMAGPLCEGPVTGTTRATATFEIVYERAGEIVRCGWHGWEFDLTTGECLASRRHRARSYPTAIEDGWVVVALG